MIFNERSNLGGKHAFLSPSKYHWVNYDDEKLLSGYSRHNAARLGTQLHDFCEQAIMLGVRLPDDQTTLSLYVNDAIDGKMECEIPLYYSDNCFGHVDALSFRNGVLHVHDLKTGTTKASFTQLEIYAALFCLEYGVLPFDIEFSLRIYQNDEIQEHIPYPEAISEIMDKIVYFDQLIESAKSEQGE